MKTLLLIITVTLITTTAFAGDCYRNSPAVQMQQDMDAIINNQHHTSAYRSYLIMGYNNKWGTNIDPGWNPHETEDRIRHIEEMQERQQFDLSLTPDDRNLDDGLLRMEMQDLKDEVRKLREALGRTNTE